MGAVSAFGAMGAKDLGVTQDVIDITMDELKYTNFQIGKISWWNNVTYTTQKSRGQVALHCELFFFAVLSETFPLKISTFAVLSETFLLKIECHYS